MNHELQTTSLGLGECTRSQEQYQEPRAGAWRRFHEPGQMNVTQEKPCARIRTHAETRSKAKEQGVRKPGVEKRSQEQKPNTGYTEFRLEELPIAGTCVSSSLLRTRRGLSHLEAEEGAEVPRRSVVQAVRQVDVSLDVAS